jgi:HD-GYP domain-containing protein (c-di-GMP phosphodiesterase class II)/HAMP domain-containing protein
MKIFNKLIIAFMSITILIWLTGLLAVHVSRSELKRHFEQNSTSLARQILHEVDEHVYMLVKVIQEYSQDELLRNAIEESNARFEAMDNYQAFVEEHDRQWKTSAKYVITPFMREILQTPLSGELRKKQAFYSAEEDMEVFSEIFVTNKYGAIVALTGKTTDYRQDDETWWRQARSRGIYLGDIDMDESSETYAIYVAVRVDDDNGNFIGVIKAVINSAVVMNTFKEFQLSEFHRGHKNMKVRLLTRDGKIIYSSVKGESFLQDASSLLNISEDMNSSKTHNGVSEAVIKRSEAEGGDLYVIHAHSDGYEDFKGFGWILYIEHDADEIFAPADALEDRIILICLIVTIIAIGMALIISRGMTKSIGMLRDAAIKIGKGKLDTVIDVSSNDEIGQLADEFRKMTDNLKSTTVKLDEFAREVDERRKAEEMLRQSEQDWEDTFNTITDIITIHDRNYNIIKANKAASTILNISESAILAGTKCHRHYHGTDRPPDECPSCNCYNTGKPATFEIFEPHLNSYFEIKSIPRFDREGKIIGLIHVARDITKRKNDEKLIQSHLKKISALRSIDRAIIGTLDLHVMLDVFLEKSLEQLRIDAATVLVLNRHTNTLDFMASSGFRSQALAHTSLKLGESNAGRAAVERRIVYIANLMEDEGSFARSHSFEQEDFVTYFAIPLIAKGHVKGVLELFNRKPFSADTEWIEFLETIANQGALAIDNATMFDEIQKSNMELTLAYDSTIEGWSRAMDMRDRETEGHSQRVAEMTVRVAREMGIRDEELLHMRRGAYLHDMGKMAIPDSILLKPGKLNEEEWKIMKMHPVYAHEMLSPIAYLRPALDIPYYHHEKWDGSGYPRGLKGTEIPVAARIFAIVDVWDALLSDRPYRAAWPAEKVYEYIEAQAGSHFDPTIVRVFLKVVRAIDKSRARAERLSSSTALSGGFD